MARPDYYLYQGIFVASVLFLLFQLVKLAFKKLIWATWLSSAFFSFIEALFGPYFEGPPCQLPVCSGQLGQHY